MTVPRDTVAPIGAGQRIGRYQITRKIGQGGMGVVYRARDESLRRDVAIKVLPLDVARDADRVERFQREARAAAALEHPNILAVHELGEHGGRPFIVTELLRGRSLKQAIAERDLTPKKAVGIAVQIADGLAAAHDRGIVHRDLKPANVFLTSDGRVKILDFGLARLRPEVGEETLETASFETESGVVAGTPGYMAPEQVRGETADHRADIFALGCVLYEMLSRRRPFAGETTAETMAAVLREDPPKLSDVARGVPPGLERIVERCLEKRPEARFSSARDVGLALDAASIDSIGGTLARRPRRWWRAAAISVVVALAAGATILWRSARPDASTGPHQQTVRRIAVLPLQNLSGDPEREFFADGITHSIIAELGTISGLWVIGSRSVMRFKDTDTPIPEIARMLDVEFLVSGSVVATEGKVRIFAELINPSDGQIMWSRTYERDMGDIVNLQGEVARAVSREIRVQLTSDEERRLSRVRPVDPRAHEAYLMGVHYDMRDWKKSLSYLERAVEIDPNHAEAWVRLSSVLTSLVGDGQMTVAEALPREHAAIQRALEIDPELAAAHAALGKHKAYVEWDWWGAEAAFKKAAELDPDDQFSYGYFLTVVGRFDEGFPLCEAAFRQDPFSLPIVAYLIIALASAERYEEAITHLERMRQLGEVMRGIDVWLGIIYLAMGRYDEAVAACDRVNESEEYCGQVYAMAGESEKALRRLEAIKARPVFARTYVAGIYAGLGEMDEAFVWLEKAYEERQPWLPGWMTVPMVKEAFGGDPRFHDIRRRMGLPYQGENGKGTGYAPGPA